MVGQPSRVSPRRERTAGGGGVDGGPGGLAPGGFGPHVFGSYPTNPPTGGDSSHEPDRKSSAARRCGGEPARLGITRLRPEPGAGRQQPAAAD